MSNSVFSWRLVIALWILGLPGILVTSTLALPKLLPPGTPPASLPVMMAAAAVQSAVLLALSAWGGTAAAARVGLSCPMLDAWVHRRRMPPGQSPRLVAGGVGGLLGAALLLSLPAFTPQALLAAQERSALPLVVRLLYGGVTEEILVRWGLMSGLLWAIWRILLRGQGAPKPGAVAVAVLASSVMFGVAHLPAAVALAGTLDAGIIVYVVTANAVFGVVAGYLFWKHGLESAVLAHVLAHAGAFALGP